MKIIISITITAILVCACSENNAVNNEMSRLCEVKRADVDKAMLANLICSDLNVEAAKMFSVEEMVVVLKTLDEMPNNNHEAFMAKLSPYPGLVEKTKCFQAMAIYDTDDPNILKQCLKYRPAFD